MTTLVSLSSWSSNVDEKNKSIQFVHIDEHITLASNVSSCAILGFSFVDADGDNIVCKIIKCFAE